jgi:WD40 repeat-containing protein SMU1
MLSFYLSRSFSCSIIKLMLQFCNENGLQRTVSCLSEESKVTLNTVENADTFLSDVTAGRWDSVLSSMAQLQLPRSILMDVYEQVVKEMIEMRELDLARELLRKTPACAMLKIDQPGRYLRLDQLLALSFWDPTEAYPGGATKQSRRAIIAQALAGHISSVPPSRMLALLSQALKWQQYQGTLPPGASFDLFAGEPVDTKRASDSGGRMTESNQPEMHPTQRQNQIGFGKDSYCETAAFSPDGAFMVTGSVDGFIEVYEPDTGKLRRDLDYQNNEEFMMHDDKVLCASFSRDSELLCTGSLDGKLKVWKIKTGQCVRRFEKAHGGGVTCACFGHDGTSVVTGSFDSTLRTHGLKSGKMIREFRGHASFVNAVGEFSLLICVPDLPHPSCHCWNPH